MRILLSYVHSLSQVPFPKSFLSNSNPGTSDPPAFYGILYFSFYTSLATVN